MGAEVVEVATRSMKHPWTDDTLVERLAGTYDPTDTVIAIDAPLTRPACSRCERPVCPGMEACAEPAVIWLRTEGRALVRQGDVGRPWAEVSRGPRTAPRRGSRRTPTARPTS